MFHRFFDEGLAQASFFLACPRSREAIVIDPRRDVDVYVEMAKSQGLRIARARGGWRQDHRRARRAPALCQSRGDPW